LEKLSLGMKIYVKEHQIQTLFEAIEEDLLNYKRFLEPRHEKCVLFGSLDLIENQKKQRVEWCKELLLLGQSKASNS
jgi:hypothetical protein